MTPQETLLFSAEQDDKYLKLSDSYSIYFIAFLSISQEKHIQIRQFFERIIFHHSKHLEFLLLLPINKV